MTTKSQLTKLFNFDPKTPRIVGFGIGGGVIFNPENPEEGGIGTLTTLADPRTKKRTDKQLITFLNRADALSLATAIVAFAQKQKWPELSEGNFEIVEFSSEDTKH